MPRYVMASRRAGKFKESEKAAAREAIDLSVSSMSAGINVVNDLNPQDPMARRTVVFDADPGEMAARAADLPDDVILEPEILHYREGIAPMDFVDADRNLLAGPVGTGPGFDVRVRGGGGNLRGAEVILFLRGPGNMSRRLSATTNGYGRVAFDFSPFWTPSALLAVPAGNFWPAIVRGPMDGDDVDCLPLPENGPIDWWHESLGVDKHLKTRGRGIRVGVADTGVGPHPCLDHVTDIGAFINGQFLPNEGADVDSHGTHVSGTIAARPNKASQYAGIAAGVELFSARVFPPDSGANQGDIANAIDALSATHRADLINLSLGAPTGSEIERDAIRDALERGTLCVCAAANSGGPVEFPAAFPETVAVSAIGQLGRAPAGTLSSIRIPTDPNEFGFDNYFLANFSCRGPEITCAGPGVGIISTVPERFELSAPYAAMDGTSMASPAACAALAAVLSKSTEYKSLPRDQTRAELARRLLLDNGMSIGLSAVLEGAGLPQVP